MKLRPRSSRDLQFCQLEHNLAALVSTEVLDSKSLTTPIFCAKLSASLSTSKSGPSSAWKRISKTVNTFRTSSTHSLSSTASTFLSIMVILCLFTINHQSRTSRTLLILISGIMSIPSHVEGRKAPCPPRTSHSNQSFSSSSSLSQTT